MVLLNQKQEKGKLYFLAGLLAFLSIHAFFVAKMELFVNYFFIFAWWTYIIMTDGFIYWQTGSSLIIRLKTKFFLLTLASAFFWSFFEIFNSRIVNWSYESLAFPSSGVISIFRLLAFGSVLPGILETYHLLKLIGVGKRLEFLQWEEKTSRFFLNKNWGHPHHLWICLGLVMLILPLFLPYYFFWTIWLAIIFILDPLVEKANGQSILAELRQGKVRNFYRLLLTGLICGLLWEAWNYKAGLKWVYNVPLIEGMFKVFEMPILGYLGFLPFAVECYVFYQWLACQYRAINKLRISF